MQLYLTSDMESEYINQPVISQLSGSNLNNQSQIATAQYLSYLTVPTTQPHTASY